MHETDLKKLMVGDFVMYTDNDGAVYALKVASVNDRYEVFLVDDEGTEFDLFRDEDLETIEPIIITKEFLLKNGFHESGLSYEHDVYIKHVGRDELGHMCNTVRVCLYDSCTLVQAENGGCLFNKKIHLPYTPYVHQLQQACRMCDIEIDWKL